MNDGGSSKRLLVVLAVVAVLMGVIAAELAAWTCDDAYISVRYARNLVEGHGLVFNPGERVEGYTNLSWTLILALGLVMGLPADGWMVQLGVLSFAVTLGLLAFGRWRRRTSTPVTLVPVAALVLASHEDSIIFATSGLETAFLTALVLGGYLALEGDLHRDRMRGWPAGLLLGLAVATRPDAALFAAAGGLAFVHMRRVRALVTYGIAVAATVGPLVLWRWGYYGDLLPNTYYAKSAGTPWWSQGLSYLGLYLEQYASLLVGLVLAAVLAIRRRVDDPPWWAFTVALMAGIGLYAFAIVRVGGDFMFGRLFVPLTPLLALLLERTLAAVAPGRTVVHLAVVTAVVGLAQLLPRPVSAQEWRHGVADEWAFYEPRSLERSQRQAEALARAVDGLDVRVGFLGGMARVVDEARLPYALDVETGLTDRGMARRPLEERGRPGHEKRAQVGDLLDRRLHFVIGSDASRVLRISESLPVIPITLGELEGVLVHWDPAVIEVLRQRGAIVQDFPRELDQVIARLPELGDGQVRSVEARVRRFYFDYVDDPEREAAFKARLGR